MDELDIQEDKENLQGLQDLQHVESRVQDDGRIHITFDRAYKFFHGPGRGRDRRNGDDMDKLDAKRNKHRSTKNKNRHSYMPHIPDGLDVTPRMNIAILITGSRGDVQPFIALGQVLKAAPYHHRVRICTHPTFKDFVEENDLEFFSIGGDPAKLMAYMVKNPGIIPGLDSLRAGDVGQRKADLAEMMDGAWRGCTQAGDGMTKIHFEDLPPDEDVLLSLPPPFVADAIIANPPTYAHVHIAEKLGVPLHLMFTMPWSPTGEFPHPLANMDSSKVDANIANYLSYKRIELLTWTGLVDIINYFREKTLMLDPVSATWGHSIFPRLKVPFTYCWSEALIPKPADWGPYITISGFFFLSLASKYKPDPELQAFLDAGPPPVYIGFGSIVVDDPDALTQMIFEATKKAGVRALVSKGWGNVGGSNPPDNVHLLGNVPHDWLFTKVSAVVHHGGAGTTAIGIALGKPTVIVPFFGDQPWWAGMIYRAGAGPEAVPFKQLTADKLAKNITRALEPDIREKAAELAEKIRGEDGAKQAAKDFHSMPQMKHVGCFICPDRVAVWQIRKTNIQLSSVASAVLVTRGKLKPEHLKLLRHKRWHISEGAQEPIVGALSAFTVGAMGLASDIADYKRDLTPPKKHLHSQIDNGGARQKPTDNDPIAATTVPGRTSTQSEATATDSTTSAKTSIDTEKGIGKASHHDVKRGRSHRHSRVVSATGTFADSAGAHVMKMPVAMLYNITNGFHNAPAYFLGDPTVRPRDNITGLGSGLKAGGKELTYGFYDAFTGLVTQPYHGYKEGADKGIAGAAWGISKGVSRGLGGLVFKSGAAIFGIPGYGLKGLAREVERWHSGSDNLNRSELNIIQRAKNDISMEFESHQTAKLMWQEAKGAGVGKRIVERRVWQGYREVKELRKEKKEGFDQIEEEILKRWKELAVDDEFLARLTGNVIG